MKNKRGISIVIGTSLLIVISALIYTLTNEPVKINKTRHVKKFAERKTFIPKAKNISFKKNKKVKHSKNNKTVNLKGRDYIVNENLTAYRAMSNGVINYKEQNKPNGMPILTNSQNGMKAIFTGNILIKINDGTLLKTLSDKFGLKLIQEFKHLGTYYLVAKNPQMIIKNIEKINQLLKGSRVEYELIENPIKLK